MPAPTLHHRSSNLDACISSGSIFGIYNPGECVIDDSDDADAMLQKCLTNVKKVSDTRGRAILCLWRTLRCARASVGEGVDTMQQKCPTYLCWHGGLASSFPFNLALQHATGLVAAGCCPHCSSTLGVAPLMDWLGSVSRVKLSAKTDTPMRPRPPPLAGWH